MPLIESTRDDSGKLLGSITNAVPSTKEESELLDKLIESSKNAIRALDKNPALLAKYSSPNDIIATVGANGDLSIAGTGKLTQAKVRQVQDDNATLQNRMEDIRKELDPDKRQSLLNSFQADFAEQLSKNIQKQKEIADSQSGVPQLRAQLIASEARDKADPLYYKYQSDSTGTARIRNALMQAENHSRAITKDLVANDPQINKQHALVTTFLDTENKNLAKLLQKREATAEQINQETAGLTEENLKVLDAQYPGKTEEELRQIAYGMKKNPATRADSAVLLDPTATPEDYATFAVSGIRGAIPYVVKEQSARTGESPDKVKSDIQAMQVLVNNDQLLMDAVKKIGTADEKKKFADMLMAHKLDKGKESQIEWHKTKINWVLDMQGRLKLNNLNSDVKNWQPLNGISIKDIPEIKDIIDRYAVHGKSVGINELIDRYVTDAPTPQQAERFKLIKDFYSSNLDTINKGLYGKTDKVASMKALEARFIGSNFFDTLNTFRERALESKPFAVKSVDTPKSNTEVSADKVSAWLKDQLSSGTVHAPADENIYNKPTPNEVKRNRYYKEHGETVRGISEVMSSNPELLNIINSTQPSSNVEDRR